MLDPVRIGQKLAEVGIGFYSGVPCSLLKPLINFAMSEANYLPAVNEGDAVAHCAGAWIGGKKSAVLMQNSGLGNAVSPLTSLNYIFDIPVLGFVSLRGDPDVQDEPQHELMGQITTSLLDTMRIPWSILSDDEAEALTQIDQANAYLENRQSFFFVVKKSTFAHYPTPQPQVMLPPVFTDIQRNTTYNGAAPLRRDVLTALRHQLGNRENLVILATTGLTGRELYEAGHSDNQFYMVGSMGCISAIALGLAMTRPDLRVVAVDGDGALLMRMGNLATLGAFGPDNLCHLLLDNAAHESTGGQETVSHAIDFAGLARAAGYRQVTAVQNPDQLLDALESWLFKPVTAFFHLPIQAQHSADLGRPKESPKYLLNQLISRINKRKELINGNVPTP